jgi:hypothetical protein
MEAAEVAGDVECLAEEEQAGYFRFQGLRG